MGGTNTDGDKNDDDMLVVVGVEMTCCFDWAVRGK